MNEQHGWYDSESHDSLGTSPWLVVVATLSHLRKDRPRYTSTILATSLSQDVNVALSWIVVALADGQERVLNMLGIHRLEA